MARPTFRSRNARSAAAEAVRRVVEDTAFSQLALSGVLERTDLDGRDRGFATHLTYGTLTFLGGIERILESKLKNGLESVEPSAAATLRVAVFELFFSQERPASAIIVNEAVAALPPGMPKGLRGLVNGVLRNLVRSEEKVFQSIKRSERIGVPDWMMNSLIDVVGEERGLAIIEKWNAPSQTWVRSALEKGELEKRFEERGKALHPHPAIPFAFAVDGAVHETPGFMEEFVVQDPGAQLAGWMCSAELGVRVVVDACAGLGGKTAHLHEMFPAAEVHAIDDMRKKLNEIPANPQVAIHVATLGDTADNKALNALRSKADIVVVDAPCTALGTIGRHPEIRWKRQPKDVDSLVEVQRAVLADSASFVKPGGLLVYCVCTWTTKETQGVVDAFLAKHEDFALEPYSPLETVSAEAGLFRSWPDEFPTDGFFYARMRRVQA